MPSRKPHLRLQDIVENARLIEACTRGLSRDAFERDPLRRDALRHDYDALNLDRVWEIVARDLPSLRAACEAALRRLEAGA